MYTSELSLKNGTQYAYYWQKQGSIPILPVTLVVVIAVTAFPGFAFCFLLKLVLLKKKSAFIYSAHFLKPVHLRVPIKKKKTFFLKNANITKYIKYQL